jgi:hypothetical protein
MDYTTIDYVKQSLHIKEDTDDALLSRLVTAASRTLDLLCGRSNKATDYFTLEDVVGEVLTGRVSAQGHLLCWPHKAIVNSVSALAYRARPQDSWQIVDPTTIAVSRMITVEAWQTMFYRPQAGYFVQISYNGGYSASAATLPADFVEVATLLAGRYYKEAETGMTDAMGIAELGMLTYTKALPQRVKEMIKNYQRTVPW